MNEKQPKNLKKRPPIVVVMGHIDHGKTTLLDYIRKTNVAAKEAGGITQSVGAYEIVHNEKKITFIDTPGHEAFVKMRQRGSQVADLAILIVAADEGVKPQTKEALSHIQSSGIPFLVAINKIDKPGINIEKVKNELMASEVLLEGYGGNISWQAISAKTGQGVQELLDLLVLAAELEDLKYNPDDKTEGVIIEARLDNRRGITASAIVKNGILRLGQNIATATVGGKIKALENFLGERVEFLEPSAPALILGFESLPQIGEEFSASDKEIAVASVKKSDFDLNPERRPIISEENAAVKIKLILKADNAGSLEALAEAVKNMPSAERLEILEQNVGEINENDLKSAYYNQAIIVGFRTGIDKAAENLKTTYDIRIITSSLIYELIQQVEKCLTVFKETTDIQAELEVLAVFGASDKNKQIIGGRIVKGILKNQANFTIWRREKFFSKGRILNLQSERKDVSEAPAGKEAGLLVEADEIIRAGDILKVFGQ